MKLRRYQEETVNKMCWGITLEGNSLVQIPTGGGKTIIIAEFVKRFGHPVLILVPSKELLEQDLAKLSAVVESKYIGVFSASMDRKEVKTYTLATIQSAYKHPELFNHYQVVLIDEADELNPKNLDGMYNSFFQAIGNPRIIGLTATPFRMDSYYKRWGRLSWQLETIHTLKVLTRYQHKFWSRILHTVPTMELIEQGFLTPLTYHQENYVTQDQLAFNKSKSDFNLDDFEKKFNNFINKSAQLIESLDGSVLVFCATVSQAENLQEKIPEAQIVTGKTSKKEREKMIEEFRSGELKVILNVGVLLIGFDKPDLRNIVICRPTRSLRLWFQLLGRGMRIAPGKTTCHIYDLVGNTQSIGRAESMRMEKVNGLWDIRTDAGFWHYKEIYKYKLKAPTYTEDQGEQQTIESNPDYL